MFNIKIADIAIGIDNKYEYIEKMCRDYITDETPEFTVSATDEEIMREDDGQPGEFPTFYLETLAIYRKIANKLADFDGFLMHGVLMDCEGKGILLCAESGTGKSTHAALWLRLLGDKCEIINGDKPLIRIQDGKAYAYGTPWCGKEEINKNARVTLDHICFIERAKDNSVIGVKKGEIVQRMLPSVHIPSGAGAYSVLGSIDVAARGAKFYRILCNMDISAAETAYSEIMKG